MDPPGMKKTFLDLTITLSSDMSITTKTYHKPLNLHLYIPPASAHPPGVLFGLIAGLLRRFWLQNSHEDDYKRNVAFLFTKLRERGHDAETLKELFSRASEKIVSRNGNTKQFIQTHNERKNTKRTMFFHCEYHPRGIPRPHLQSAWHSSVGELIFYEDQTICYSRPRNLRDLLIPSNLGRFTGHNPSDILRRLSIQ